MKKKYEHERKEIDRDRVGAQMPTPDWGTVYLMREYLESRSLDHGTALFNHWYPSRNAMDGWLRIVIPASNQPGLAYWQARLVSGPDDAKRYTSPPVPRGDSLIVVWPRVLNGCAVVLSEGPMDALAAASVGVPGIALMGNQPALSALEHATRVFPISKFLILPDGDSLDSAHEWMRAVISFGREAEIVLPGPYKDLAQMSPDARMRILV